MIEWICAMRSRVRGLATTGLNRRLVLRGQAALRLCYFGGYPYSEDIDLAALESVTQEETCEGFRQAAEWIRRESALQAGVLSESLAGHAEGFSFEMTYTGPLGGMAGRRSIQGNVDTRERILFHAQDRRINRHYSDIPRKPEIRCVALDEIVCEKFRSLLDPARREPRDVYDLWYLFDHGGADVERIRTEYRSKAKLKKLDPDALVDMLAHKEGALGTLGENRLANQIADLPPFEAAFKRVQREARRLEGESSDGLP